MTTLAEFAKGAFSEPIKGQITTFCESKCPCCGHDGLPNGAGPAFLVGRIWNGSQWLLLDSWAGKSLAIELGSQPIDIGAQLDANQTTP